MARRRRVSTRRISLPTWKSFPENIQTRKFATLEAFCAEACKPESSPHLGEVSRTQNHCNTSFADALDLAAHGWPQGTKRIRDIVSKINVPVFQEAMTQTFHDTSGSYVDVDRYLSGEPECMVEFAPDTRVKKTVRIGFSATYSAIETEATINNRGAAIGALIDILESRNIRCEVVAITAFASKTSGDIVSLECTIKNPEQPLDLDRIAFVCAHPAFLRRLGFAIGETFPRDLRLNLGTYYGKSYGRVWTGTAPGFDAYIPSQVAALWTKQTAIDFVNETLARITSNA